MTGPDHHLARPARSIRRGPGAHVYVTRSVDQPEFWQNPQQALLFLEGCVVTRDESQPWRAAPVRIGRALNGLPAALCPSGPRYTDRHTERVRRDAVLDALAIVRRGLLPRREAEDACAVDDLLWRPR